MISLTTQAAAAVKAAMARAADAAAGPRLEGLRLLAEAEASRGVRLMMHLEHAARDGDVVIEQCGVKLFIDGRSRAIADGVCIDFVSSPAVSGFVVADVRPAAHVRSEAAVP